VSPKLVGYCIALAAGRHGIAQHSVMVMSNHWHALLTDSDGGVTEFARDRRAAVNRRGLPGPTPIERHDRYSYVRETTNHGPLSASGRRSCHSCRRGTI
jgi:hypothetical protein